MALPEGNRRMIEESIRIILMALGEDPEREGLRDTPKRVADLYDDVLDGAFAEPPKVTAFVEETVNHMVVVHHVPFYGFCEHHLAMFFGHFSIGYVPDKKLVGLSKLVRIFRHFTKRVTIQERLTEQSVDGLVQLVEPKGAIVYVNAEHTCMSLRGVKSPGSRTTTIAARGIFQSDSELRQQFVGEARNGSR